MNIFSITILFFLNLLIGCSNTIPTSSGHELPNLIKIKINNSNNKITKISLFDIENNNLTRIKDSSIINTDSIEFKITDTTLSYIIIAYNEDSSLGAILKPQINNKTDLTLKETGSLTLKNLNTLDEIKLSPYPNEISTKLDSTIIKNLPPYTYIIFQTTDSGTIIQDTITIMPNQNIIFTDLANDTISTFIDKNPNIIINWDFNNLIYPEIITNYTKLDSLDSNKFMVLDMKNSKITSKNNINKLLPLNNCFIKLEFDFNDSDLIENEQYSLFGISNDESVKLIYLYMTNLQTEIEFNLLFNSEIYKLNMPKNKIQEQVHTIKINMDSSELKISFDDSSKSFVTTSYQLLTDYSAYIGCSDTNNSLNMNIFSLYVEKFYK